MKQYQAFRFDYIHRSVSKAMGFTTKELSQPRVAVVNSWGEGSPGHVHLRAITEGVKAAGWPV
jgi:dihydroxy-acid dehydratase